MSCSVAEEEGVPFGVADEEIDVPVTVDIDKGRAGFSVPANIRYPEGLVFTPVRRLDGRRLVLRCCGRRRCCRKTLQ